MNQLINKITCGDCVKLLGKIKEPFADLIFADPPFNIGYKYDKYNDNQKAEKYIAWTKKWMLACINVLKPKGSFYIAIGDDYAANVKIIADELGLFMRNWIIWHYTFGQQAKNKFARSHTHIFYFVKNKKSFVFNDHAVRIPSDRQLIYNDKRADSKGKLPDDVWSQYSRVCGTFKERTGFHPCQMPENLLKRIISVSSNPGDCVLDPFIGSGTTAVATIQLERQFAGIDISEKYCTKAMQRVEQAKQQKLKNRHLDNNEINTLKQLLADMQFTPKQILNNSRRLEFFTRQFAVRMNNDKKYTKENIILALTGTPD